MTLTRELRRSGSRRRAEQEQSYQKSSWEHWGIPVPAMDIVIRKLLPGVPPKELLSLSARLWGEPVWDLKIVAARVLARDAVPPTERLWRFVYARVPDLDGWAIADNLAVVGSRCLLADTRRLDRLEGWIRSGHLWSRRAALVFTLPWTKEARDPRRMLAWAGQLAGDPEWFIQKAIGWWLRELSKRDPARVRAFLKKHGPVLKSVAHREASKYL